jgi:hypothetical protein|tara:strand:+ start:830 stop:1228 length:399 start_codon:yes stop_codon:yes gene_type:complete
VSSLRDDVKGRIDAIEESYEFFLAFAAQGLTSDQGSKSGGQLRIFLSKSEAALDGLAGALRGLVVEASLEPATTWAEVLDVVERDASDALSALRLVAAQSSVSSQLIDNLNANIHFRALLTDLFLVDELIGA